MQKKIFISHASIDERVGEKLVDALVAMGVPQDTIFFSSKYHTGVGLGNNFSNVVKSALAESEIVIFLLTKNFYRSEYCLNEMGAVWFSDKKCIPILLGNLTFSDMRGFLDSHYIAFMPKHEESYKLFVELQKYISAPSQHQLPESIFSDFIEEANKVVETTEQYSTESYSFLSKTEKLLLQGRLTDNEIILLNFFVENQSDCLEDVPLYDSKTNSRIKSLQLLEFEQYCSRYIKFDYKKAKNLLQKSGFLSFVYSDDFEPEYIGCELETEFFRDMISLSEKAKKYIDEILTKHRKPNAAITVGNADNVLDNMILDNKLSEIEVLLLAFMLQSNQMTLGTRWMTAGTVSNILSWEEKSGIKSRILSNNYESALNSLINREMVDVASYTAYGNPREYRLKQPLINQLLNLSPQGVLALVTTISNNATKPDEPPPF